MKSVQYNLKSCLIDNEDTIHIVLENENRGVFTSLYVDGLIYRDLVETDKPSAQSFTYHWDFLKTSWSKMGFDPYSIIFDAQGKTVFSVMTFFQNYMHQKFAYVTIFVPIGDAIMATMNLGTPIYFTDRAEAGIKKISLDKYDSYVKSVTGKK